MPYRRIAQIFLLYLIRSLTLLLISFSVLPAAHAKRLALVIGNDSYLSVPVLRNARADARAVADALESAGFSVTLKTDLNERAFLAALREFSRRVQGGDDTVFYYAGHGVQIGGGNYLLPTDIASEDEEQVKDESIPLQRVLNDLQDQKVRFTLAIIDACRDNPFKGRGRSIGGRGLQPVNPATGQMVLYSAGAGQQALDRLSNDDRDPNGLFTRILLKEMSRQGISADRMLRNVRDQVVSLARNAGHDQVPALYDQTIGEFYFKRGRAIPRESAPTPNNNPDTPPQSQRLSRIEPDPAEAAYWAEVQKSDDPDYYAAYIAAYPNGLHLADASDWIERDKQAKAARERLKEDQAWQETQRNESINAFDGYLKSYPNGRYAALAKLKLTKLEAARQTAEAEQARSRKLAEDESQLWSLALGNSCREGYNEYLRRYPEGQFSAQARERLIDVEKTRFFPLGTSPSGKQLAYHASKGNCLACHALPTEADALAPGNSGPPLIAMSARFPDRKVLRQAFTNGSETDGNLDYLNQTLPRKLTNSEINFLNAGKHRPLSEDEIDKILKFIYRL